jgi:hypothetical protein
MAAPHLLLIAGVLATVCGLGAVGAGLAPLELEAASSLTLRVDRPALAPTIEEQASQWPIAGMAVVWPGIRESGELMAVAPATTRRTAVTTAMRGAKMTELMGGVGGIDAMCPAGARANPLLDRREDLLHTAYMLLGRKEGSKPLMGSATCRVAVDSLVVAAASGSRPESVGSIVPNSDREGEAGA